MRGCAVNLYYDTPSLYNINNHFWQRYLFQPWRKIWTYKENDQRDTFAAALRL